MDVSTALEVSFLHDTNVYFLPILESGLAVRHVAMHVQRLFKLENEILICKPHTRIPLPGSMMILPGRAITICPTVQRKVVAEVSCREVPDIEIDQQQNADVPLPDDGTPSYIAQSLSVRFDAVVSPDFRCGVAAFFVYEPVRTASREALLAFKRHDVQMLAYRDGKASKNAAECELHAFADALSYAAEHPHCGSSTRIEVVTESTYCIHMFRVLQKTPACDTATFESGRVTQIRAVMNRRTVHVTWSSHLTYEYGRFEMTDLRRLAVAWYRKNVKDLQSVACIK